ncbi:hypothetical protein CLOM_g24002 [Closterium sp. NIES-68]|nr:hypothetical protein CLOM_g24002 [Closterium sp. NIES-68]GJP78784.1 hypothetical protein CLOP_g9057 [Closterium sp. NIES-67]
MAGIGDVSYQGVVAAQLPPPCDASSPQQHNAELRPSFPHLALPAHALPRWIPHIPAAGSDPAALRAIANCRVACDGSAPWGYGSQATQAARAEGTTGRAEREGLAEGRAGKNRDRRENKRQRGENEGGRDRWGRVTSGGRGGAADREGRGKGQGRSSYAAGGREREGGKGRAGRGGKGRGMQGGATSKAVAPLAFPATCPLCPDVVLTSLSTLHSHITGRKHQAAVAGCVLGRGGHKGGRPWSDEWQQEEKPLVGLWDDGGVKEQVKVEVVEIDEAEEKEEEESVVVAGRRKRKRAVGCVSVGPPFVGGWCEVCGATCLNESNFKFHLKGKRHHAALAANFSWC